MSIEAIQQISQAEASAQEKKQAAFAKAKQMKRDAEQNGEQLLEQTRQKAEQESRAMMTAAEQAAAKQAAQLLSDNARVCEQLCSVAESHLDEAAALIVKRIVNV